MALFKKPQQLCNIAWSLAKLHHANSLSLLETLTNRAKTTLSMFAYHEVTILLWALNKLKFYPGDEFLVEAEKYLRRTTLHAKPQEISNALLAFADFGSYLPNGIISRDLMSTLKAGLRTPVSCGRAVVVSVMHKKIHSNCPHFSSSSV